MTRHNMQCDFMSQSLFGTMCCAAIEMASFRVLFMVSQRGNGKLDYTMGEDESVRKRRGGENNNSKKRNIYPTVNRASTKHKKPTPMPTQVKSPKTFFG